METKYYVDYIMRTILWKPNTVSIIETKSWRLNFGDLILWKLYYRNLVMETMYSTSWRPNYEHLILW